jgi:hypothetical protein
MEKLAIEGGKPVNTEPFPMWPSFSEKTIQMVAEPLKTGKVNYWTGEIGVKFEKAWAEYNGAKYCITTTNGTSALHTAVSALGIFFYCILFLYPSGRSITCICGYRRNTYNRPE